LSPCGSVHMRSAEFGVGGRRQIAEPAVWPNRIVVILEDGEHLPRMGERGEQRLIEQLVAKAPIETLDEGVLLRLARGDVMPFDPGLLGPAQNGDAGQFRSIVGDAHGRPASHSDEGVELAHDPQARQRCIGRQRQAFSGEVVDHRQDPKSPAIDERVRQEIQAPALIGALRDRHWSPCAQDTLAATAAADLKSLLPIKPA
jgi:hypothetical protein